MQNWHHHLQAITEAIDAADVSLRALEATCRKVPQRFDLTDRTSRCRSALESLRRRVATLQRTDPPLDLL